MYLMNMGKTVLIFFLVNFVFRLTNSAQILGIVPTTSYSHQIAFRPLWRELSLRGHQLTVLTTDPMNDPSLTNLTEIDLHFTYKLWNKNVLEMIKNNQKNVLKTFEVMQSTVNAIIDKQLEHPPVQALIKNETEHFDLLIIEAFAPAMTVFSERFQCPFIGMTSFDAPSIIYNAIGNPAHPVLNPDANMPFTGPLTFWQRLISTFFKQLVYFYLIIYGLPTQQAIANKHFGENYSQLKDIGKKMSMLFVNADPIFSQIRPLVPSVVQIGGGTHRQPSKPLPEDLNKLLDGATEGFIYFSLGSNVKSKDLTKSTQKTILEVFSELPHTVLWKFELEAEDLPMKPKNVFISKWYPQQDIFKHPNIKLFITQGGQQSMEEAIYDYIPMVGMPFAGDQLANVKRIVDKGLGLSADHESLDKDTFKKTILEVINNPKYRKRVRELADLAKDQPMTGLEKAVWWSEYVLRHKGAKHLRSPVLDIPSYQYYLLDVIGFCFVVTLLVIYLLVTIAKVIFRLLRYFSSKPKVKVQ